MERIMPPATSTASWPGRSPKGFELAGQQVTPQMDGTRPALAAKSVDGAPGP
jgi:hypothetical protein